MSTWYDRLPERYRDRVRFDPTTGEPANIDVAAGNYTVPGPLTDADRKQCNLPLLIDRRRRRWNPR